MNLILFAPGETAAPLPRADRRARHILDVLRCGVGDTFDAGLINGPRGRASLTAVTADTLTLAWTWGEPPPPADPITLLVGLPRPQTARDILRDATTLGIAALHFVRTEKGEPNYAQSALWSSGEWRRHLIAGAEQAFDTRVPEVTHHQTLLEALAAISATGSRVALDNYEANSSLGNAPLALPLTIAIGGERGWSQRDREQLRAHRFALVHLGPRVLRTETAVIAALALARARLGLMA